MRRSYDPSDDRLPLIDRTRTPRQNPDVLKVEYKKAYLHVNKATALLSDRMDKLQFEKDMIKKFKPEPADYLPPIRHGLPFFNYNNEPIRQARPVQGDRLYMNSQRGIPMEEENNNDDMMAMLLLYRMMNYPPISLSVNHNQPGSGPAALPREKTPIKRSTGKSGKDWWLFVKRWVNIWKFWSTARKYTKYGKVRTELIAEKKRSEVSDYESFKFWLLQVQKNFLQQFAIFPNMDLSFNNYSGSLKIKENTQKIWAILDVFLKSLIEKTTKVSNIPDKVQKLLYKYIRNRAYYCQGFLTTLEINRLDFNFNGGAKNMNDHIGGMILALLIISKVFCTEIMLNIEEQVPVFSNYKFAKNNCLYLASILHYLVRDAFEISPPMAKDVLALYNYYRNYHVYNSFLESDTNYFAGSVLPKDKDEIGEKMIPEDKISAFFELYPNRVEHFKKYIYKWSVNLSKFIRMKFARFDVEERKKLEKPYAKQKRVVEYTKKKVKIGEEEVEDSESEEEEENE